MTTHHDLSSQISPTIWGCGGEGINYRYQDVLFHCEGPRIHLNAKDAPVGEVGRRCSSAREGQKLSHDASDSDSRESEEELGIATPQMRFKKVETEHTN